MIPLRPLDLLASLAILAAVVGCQASKGAADCDCVATSPMHVVVPSSPAAPPVPTHPLIGGIKPPVPPPADTPVLD